jgi:N-acetylglucosaminyldiphosphoundecaprenol N-acetyl-beta-D-mannosaminyltransferase
MRTNLLGTPVDILTFEETLAQIEDVIVSRKKCVHVALNAAKFVKMRDNVELRNDVLSADIIGIDGMGVAFALRFLGAGKAPKVSGADLMMALMERCAKTGHKPYILGAKQAVLDRAIANGQANWPGLEIAGSRNGYFGAEDEAQIVADIAKSEADCLFLAMPTPQKERFLGQYADQLNVPFIMGVGGSVDVLAGQVKRAPIWMQRAGLEWFYRLLQEPRKMFWRYASTNGRFIWLVLREGVSWKKGRQA